MSAPDFFDGENAEHARRSSHAGHAPGPDWICACGYDYFGGSAAYSWQLFDAHLPATEADR